MIVGMIYLVHKYKYHTYTVAATDDNGDITIQDASVTPSTSIVNENFVGIQLDNI